MPISSAPEQSAIGPTAESFDHTASQLAQQLGEQLRASGDMVATAESCTGGMVAATITDIAGSSAWFDRGFITYSNEAKMEMIQVPGELIEAHGAVSEPVAGAMAQGALHASNATLVVAITGIAGPGGGSPEKPVGTVCFAWSDCRRATQTETRHFIGDRRAVREQSVVHALRGLLARVGARAAGTVAQAPLQAPLQSASQSASQPASQPPSQVTSQAPEKAPSQPPSRDSQ